MKTNKLKTMTDRISPFKIIQQEWGKGQIEDFKKAMDNYEDRKKDFDRFIKTTEEQLMHHFGIDMTKEKDSLTEKFLDSELDELIKKKGNSQKKILRKHHVQEGWLSKERLKELSITYKIPYASIVRKYNTWGKEFDRELKKG